MNTFRRLLSTVLIVAAFSVAGLLGYSLFTGIPLSHSIQMLRAEQNVKAAQADLATANTLSGEFKSVDKIIEPSVVNIKVRKTIRGVRNVPYDDDFLKRFFPQDQMPDSENQVPEQFEEIGTGSGVIMDVDGSTGYILTNNHVAGGAQSLEVTLADGRVIKDGKVVGADPKSDLAVVKISADHLIAAKWGDSSQLEKGDWILAFGSPFDYVGSMTHGIVSALHRQAGILGSQGYEDFIQVDAPINPGNSGGPLVNLQAEVVGINTAIASRSGGFQGIGFAIPSNFAQDIYKALKEKGKVTRGWLGVSFIDVANDLPEAKSLDFSGTTGVVVQEVYAKTPATGKLQPNDIITECNGKPIDNGLTFRTAIADMAPGAEVKFKVFRDQKYQDVTIQLGDQPEDMEAFASGRRQSTMPQQSEAIMGLHLSDVNADTIKEFSLGDVKSGALITEVDANSVAARAGLKAGDVIIRIMKHQIANAEDAAAALKKADIHRGVGMVIVNSTGLSSVFIQESGAGK